MSEVIGDVSHLRDHITEFNIVVTITGASGFSDFPLLGASGFQKLIAGRAYVKILPESLTCRVIGPVSASNAIACHVALLPAGLPNYPTTASQVLGIPGSALTRDSLYSSSVPVPLRFSPEVAHVLKPATLVGEPPQVVYCYTLVGGTSTSESLLHISGQVELSGVGFLKTW